MKIIDSLLSAQRAQARIEKANSDLIDRKIEKEKKRLWRTCNILILGSRRSGKSTLLKQLKLSHQGGFSEAELIIFRSTVYRNLLESAQALVTYMRKMGLECVDNRNVINSERILEYKLDAAPGSQQDLYFSPDIADAIHQLWNDPIILKDKDTHLVELDLMDNAEYFFGRVLTIGMPNYIPDNTDALHAYQESIGLTETQLSMGKLPVRIIDMGIQRTLRKWTHCFESVISIAFCVAMSDYDKVSSENGLQDKVPPQNHLGESIELFGSVINSRWFTRTSIILYLNKIDLFEKKLPKSPLERHFPEYTGGSDLNKAEEYIFWRFMQMNSAQLKVYPHLTQATESMSSTSVQLLFTAIQDTLLQDTLKVRNIL